MPTTGDSGPDPTITTGEDPTGLSDPTATDPTGEPDCAERRDSARAILEANCSACHSGPNAQVFDNVTDLDALVTDGKIKGGDPDGSQLYQLIAADIMPKTNEKLSIDEKLVIHDWIEQCTNPTPTASPLDPPACVGTNKFITIEEMLASMHAGVTDITEVNADDQPFIRFFTLTHLWNAGYCDEQIEAYRHAVAKLVNSLSNQPNIRLPEAVDPERTLFRIDLRDYGWQDDDNDGDDVWDLLVDRNPFAVEYLQDTAVSLKALTGTTVPFQMGDWFVTDASQAPLYDELLYDQVFGVKADIFSLVDPLNRADLEAFLGIAVDANITLEKAEDVGRVVRAGFQVSGVSEQNRVIERHEFLDNFTRSYWLSYDFVDNVDFSNIFYHPLDFVQAGGEIIWTLPNGLQGYMLVNAVGDRLSEAPINVVNNKEQGGAPIINGMSCMGCHYQGMRSEVDEVSPFAASQVGLFNAEEKEQIANLYPVAAEFQGRLDQDSDVFVSSVGKTGAPLLIAGHEVTEIAYLAFEESSIDLRRAAAELNLTPDALSPKIGQLPNGLQMINGGFVNRDSMRTEYAEAVCKLLLGITKFCPPG